jgi:hypothetical protein
MLAGHSRRRIRSTYLPIFSFGNALMAARCRLPWRTPIIGNASVVVPILMNGEQPFGIGAAAAAPIAFFIFGRDKPSCFTGEVLGVNLRLNKPIVV